MIRKMIWRNLWRNPRRTVITMASVMFAVLLSVFMMSIQRGVYDNLIKNLVGYYSGYIQVHKDGYWDERILDNAFPYDDSLNIVLKTNDFVQEVVPRIEVFSLSSGKKTTHGCVVTGIDPNKEDKLTGLKSRLVKGSYFSDDSPSAIIGEGLAKKLKIALGDSIVLLGQGYHGNMAAGKYPVVGLVHFGTPELNESSVYLPLELAQNWMSAPGMVTNLSLSLSDVKNLEKKGRHIKNSLSNNYEVMTWMEMMPVIVDMIKADGASLYIWMAVLYLIISFGIFGTILMMTNERKYEFGMLVAIGMKKSKIAAMLIGEGVMISLLGTIAGSILSLPLVLYFRAYPFKFTGDLAKAYESYGFEAIMPAVVDPKIFISQALVVLLISFIMGLYPVYYLRKMDILKSMR